MSTITTRAVHHGREIVQGIVGGVILSAPIVGITLLTDWIKSLW